MSVTWWGGQRELLGLSFKDRGEGKHQANEEMHLMKKLDEDFIDP